MLALLILVASFAGAAHADEQPNFILIMCDDMDLVLGGVSATPQVKHLLGDHGATASNYFVSSPKCTPSRSAWSVEPAAILPPGEWGHSLNPRSL